VYSNNHHTNGAMLVSFEWRQIRGQKCVERNQKFIPVHVRHCSVRIDVNKSNNAVILVRVSTSRQDTERQVSELEAYAASKGYRIVEICRETVSGRADDNDRQGLKRTEALAQTGRIQKVLVHEVSRLARKNSTAHRFVEMLESYGVSLYWHAQGVETLLPNGKRNPSAGIMLALLAEMARAEVELLRERIVSGLNERDERA
jgi:DNA invertase Pin-like site-specific DNA recombinase